MLELSSNTIKVLGIFGRLSPELERYFDELENKYGNKPAGDEYDIFRHLTLTFVPNATVADVHEQLDLLRQLKEFLPFRVRVKEAFVKDEESMIGAEHIALKFELTETKQLINFVQQTADDKTVATWYIKVAWFIPKENQQKVIDELSSLEELVFTDFYLCSNKQDEANTIFRSSDF